MGSRQIYSAMGFLLIAFLAGCGSGLHEELPDALPSPCASLKIEGTPWVPDVENVDPSKKDSTVKVFKQTYVLQGPVIGLGHAHDSKSEMTVHFDVWEDLGPYGSLTLVGEVTDFPVKELSGFAYPVLVSLHDGVNELVHMARSGEAGDCHKAGYFTCKNGSCSINDGCRVLGNSVFSNRVDWEQHQFSNFGYTSTNTFPTCDWSNQSPGCAFRDKNYMEAGEGGYRLRQGKYTAKYVMMTSDFAIAPANQIGGMRLTVLQKKDMNWTGAMDINLILVGSKNIQASRTERGKRNLDALFDTVQGHYSQGTVGGGIGRIRVYEWNCEKGGDTFSNTQLEDIGKLFQRGSELLPADTEGTALNVFIVSNINYSSSNLTVLGVAGAIGGPPVYGTSSSGTVFSSFDKLDAYNPECDPSQRCTRSKQEKAFISMATTISHEMGHYLGLNHPSERDGLQHDRVPDTPTCGTIDGWVTHNSCLFKGGGCSSLCPGYDGVNTFCPTQTSCQFNHIMFYTTQRFNSTTKNGDGTLFSALTGVILNRSHLMQ